MTTQVFKITGLTCMACTKLTAKRLKSIAGVQDATVDLGTGRAEVASDQPVTVEQARQVLAGSQYGAETYDD